MLPLKTMPTWSKGAPLPYVAPEDYDTWSEGAPLPYVAPEDYVHLE